MFYQYFLPLNYVSNIFGVSKPCISKGKFSPTNLWVKLWCLLVAVLFITSYSLSITVTKLTLKDNLELISDINDLGGNVLIIILNLFDKGNASIYLHDTFNIIFNKFQLDLKILKLFAIKMYIWFALPTIMFVVLIIMEIVNKNPPYDIIINTPIFLTTIDLSMHLYTILALLKVVNIQLDRKLSSYTMKSEDVEIPVKSCKKYILNPEIRFITYNEQIHYDIKLLCNIYDHFSTSVRLLEYKHGFEILLSIWLMLISGVSGVTVLACDKADIKWLVLVKIILPFFWGFVVCFINEQLRTEVDRTITLTIKCLIDYRCVPIMKPALETFHQLVSNDQLCFTACSLFHLSYAMLLGTVVNVITYSIILIQILL